MFNNLTKQERLVLLWLAVIFVTGFTLDGIFHHWPNWREGVSFMDRNRCAPPVDLNRATLKDLIQIPSLGETMAKRILDYRRQKGSFRNINELKNIKGMGDYKFQMSFRYLKVNEPEGR